MARAHGFNEEAVRRFFVLLQDLMVRYQFKPDHIFNVDEKTISTVHNHPPKESSRPRNG